MHQFPNNLLNLLAFAGQKGRVITIWLCAENNVIVV